MNNRFKIHTTHRKRMKKLFLEGFTNIEIAIAYKTNEDVIKNVTQALKQPERI